MRCRASSARKRSATSGAQVTSRHWLAFLVKTWITLAPIARPRAGALATPPWVETCAPISTPSALCGLAERGGERALRGTQLGAQLRHHRVVMLERREVAALGLDGRP